MAETRVQPALSPTIWADDFSVEVFQGNPFSAYAGTGNDNPIVMKENFASERGNGITFEFITNLDRGSIKGYQPLLGHEEKLGEFGDRIFWTARKKAISMHELDRDLAAIDLLKAGKGVLKAWADEDIKFEVINRLLDVGQNLDQVYGTSTATDRNTWNANNQDRIYYAGGRVNNVPGAHATSLGNITSGGGRLTRSALSMLKRLAIGARPHITPVSVSKSDNRRMFVAFVHPFVMRDFVNDLSATEATVRLADKNNGLFLGGDRDWDGVIVHEVDDMPILSGVGNSGIDVAPVYLLGQEALGWAIKSRYSPRTQISDYEQVQGQGLIGKWGMKKLGYQLGDSAKLVNVAGSTSVFTNVVGKQRGMVTGFFAAVSD